MEQKFWLNRWEIGKLGWHQDEPEPALVAWAKNLKPASRIFVPLCGKSLDLKWLAEQGHEVIGSELSTLACEQFFQEQALTPTISKQGEFSVFKSGRVTIWNGDYFQLNPEALGKFDAVYDRAALIAMPPEMRPHYSAQLLSLMKASTTAHFQWLQLILIRTPEDQEGPPFSISKAELFQTYDPYFKLELQSEENVDARGPEGSTKTEVVYLLTPKLS
jgi:thiopurine S-methyltransferase